MILRIGKKDFYLSVPVFPFNYKITKKILDDYKSFVIK